MKMKLTIRSIAFAFLFGIFVSPTFARSHDDESYGSGYDEGLRSLNIDYDTILVKDLSGNIVLETAYSDYNPIDLLPSGKYIILILDQNGNIARKIEHTK